MAKVKIQIDTSLCIAAASCTGAAPSLFRINDESFAEVTHPITREGAHAMELELNDAQMAELEEAAESCPTKAITVYKG